jgi:peptidoglycan-N-acetylmuramic acid deacetylase
MNRFFRCAAAIWTRIFPALLLAALFFFALSIAALILSGCSPTQRDAAADRKSGGSDPGGVYSSDFKDLKLEVEVSGRLSEGNGDVPTQEHVDVVIGEAAYSGVPSNKLLRWGISRRTGNQPPAADPGAPQLLKEYGGAYIGDVTQKRIYLTFDEGYENGYTPLILDTLKAHGVRAVFFITGPYLKGHEDLVRRMVEEGHLVGNHTIHHPSLPELDDKSLEEEVAGLGSAFRDKFGENMKFLRPPKGEYSERTLSQTQQMGYCNLFWSFAYDDWYRDRIRGPEYARDIVMRNLHNGAVLLLHAVSKDNADALDSIIRGAGEMGYTIGDPQELLPPEQVGN